MQQNNEEFNKAAQELSWAKFDKYDYNVRDYVKGHMFFNIDITVDGELDPVIADISSELNANESRVFIDGMLVFVHNITLWRDVFNQTFVTLNVSLYRDTCKGLLY